jgi:UDP-2,3-diacylglucosamine pyrophosphatase LpxH
MSAIVAFSDVHLGYERANSDAFIEFMKTLQSRTDLGDVVIVGDFVDLWRRDVIGLEFELSRFVEELKILQAKGVKVHYVAGNHDAHVEYLKNHGYPFEPKSLVTIERFEYTIRFLHGHQCDPLQNILGPETSDILCWTLSDDIGKQKSWLWEILASKGFQRDKLEAKIDSLMCPPEDKRRTEAFEAQFETAADFVECLKAYFKITGENEFIVYGHTHKPFIDIGKRVANTGCWIKGANPANTYFEFERWPPRLVEFKGQPLESTSIATLKF